MFIPVNQCTTKSIRAEVLRVEPGTDHHQNTRTDCIAILRAHKIFSIDEDSVQPLPRSSNKGFQMRSILHEPENEYLEQMSFADTRGEIISVTPGLETNTNNPDYQRLSDASYSNLTVNQRLDVNASLVVNNTDIDTELTTILGLRTQISNDLVGVNRTISILDAAHQQAANENLQIYEHSSEHQYILTLDDIEPQEFISDVSHIQTTCRVVDTFVYIDLSIVLTCLPKPTNGSDDYLIKVKLPFIMDERLPYTSGSFYHVANYIEGVGFDGMNPGICFIHADDPQVLNLRSSRFFRPEDGRTESTHNIMCSLQYFRKFEGFLVSNIRFGESFHTLSDPISDANNTLTTATLQWNVVGSRVELIGNVNIQTAVDGISTFVLPLPVRAKINPGDIRVGHSLLLTTSSDIWSMLGNIVTIDDPLSFKLSYTYALNKINNYLAIFHLSYERDMIDDISSFVFERPLVSASERIKLQWITHLNTNPYYFIDTIQLDGPWGVTPAPVFDLRIQGGGREWYTFVDVPSTTTSGEIYAIMTIFGNTYTASTLVDTASPTGIKFVVSNKNETSINVVLSELLDDTSTPHTLEIHTVREVDDVSESITYVYDFTKNSTTTLTLSDLKNGVSYGIKVICLDPLRNQSVTFTWMENNVVGKFTTDNIDHPTFHDLVYTTIHNIPEPYFTPLKSQSGTFRNIIESSEFALSYEADVYIHSSSSSLKHYVYTFITTKTTGIPTIAFANNLRSQEDQVVIHYETPVNREMHLYFPTMVLHFSGDTLSEGSSLQDLIGLNTDYFYLNIIAFDDSGNFEHIERRMFVDGLFVTAGDSTTIIPSTKTMEDISFTIRRNSLYRINENLVNESIPIDTIYHELSNGSVVIPLTQDPTYSSGQYSISYIPSDKHDILAGNLIFDVANLFRSVSFKINFDPFGGSMFTVDLTIDNYESLTANIDSFTTASDMTHTLNTNVYDLSIPTRQMDTPTSRTTLSFIKSIYDQEGGYKTLTIANLTYATKYMLLFEMVDVFNRRTVNPPMFVETEGLPTFSIESVIQRGYYFHVTATVATQSIPSSIIWYYRFYNQFDEDLAFTAIGNEDTQNSTITFVFENATYNHETSNIEAYFMFGRQGERYSSANVVQQLIHTGFYQNEIQSKDSYSNVEGNIDFTFQYMGDLSVSDVKLISTNLASFEIVEHNVVDYTINNVNTAYTVTVNAIDLIVPPITSGYLQLRVSANIGGDSLTDVVTVTTELDQLIIDTEACSSIDISIEQTSDGFQFLHVTNFIDDTPIPKTVTIFPLSGGESIFSQKIVFEYPVTSSDTFNIPVTPIMKDVSEYDMKYEIFKVGVSDDVNGIQYFYHPDVYLGRLRTSGPSVNVDIHSGIVEIIFLVENYVQIDDNGDCLVQHQLYGVGIDGTTTPLTSTTSTPYSNGKTESIRFSVAHLYPEYRVFSNIQNTTLSFIHSVGTVYVDLIDESANDRIHTDIQYIDFELAQAIGSSTGVYTVVCVYLDVSMLDPDLLRTTGLMTSLSFVYNIQSVDQTVSLKINENTNFVRVMNDSQGTTIVNNDTYLDVTLVGRTVPLYLKTKQLIATLIFDFENVTLEPPDFKTSIKHSLNSLLFTSDNSSLVVDLDAYTSDSLISHKYVSFESGSVPNRLIKENLTLMNHTLHPSDAVETLFSAFCESPNIWLV
jgi:hypothetical protein